MKQTEHKKNPKVFVDKIKRLIDKGITPIQVMRASKVSATLYYQVLGGTYSNLSKAEEIYFKTKEWLRSIIES